MSFSLERGRWGVLLIPVGFALVGCSASFSIGGPDYAKLEREIGTELDSAYASMSRTVDSVSCPRPSTKPKPGETFLCTATVEGKPVRVEVTVEDDDSKVRFTTIDLAFDLGDTGRVLSGDVTDQVGFPVTVDCGDGLEIVPAGDTFTCTASDDDGGTAIVEVTADRDGDHSWELIE